jgi:hypothetical protein
MANVQGATSRFGEAAATYWRGPMRPGPRTWVAASAALLLLVWATSCSRQHEGAPAWIPLDPEEALERTPDDIVAESRAALSRFGELRRDLDLFIGIDAELDAHAVARFERLASGLSDRVHEFGQSIGASHDLPLREAQSPLREMGSKIALVSGQLRLLLDAQEVCGLRHRAVLIRAVESLALQLEDTADSGDPRAPGLHYFAFEGEMPNVVPKKGGRITLVGSRPTGRKPHLIVEAPLTGATLAEFALARSDEVGVLVAEIPSEEIAGWRSRCVRLRLETGGSSSPAPGPGAAAALPLCASQSYESGLRVMATIAYETSARREWMETQELRLSNESCEERRQVSGTLEWPLHEGGRLLEMGEFFLEFGDEGAPSPIRCELIEDGVRCSGWLEPAECQEGGESPARVTPTEWIQLFTPLQEYPHVEEHRVIALSDPQPFDSGDVQLCLELPRRHPSEQTRLRFQTIAVNGNQEETFFEAPWQLVRDDGQTVHRVDGAVIEARFQSVFRPSEAEICVRFRAPACPYGMH